MLNDRRQASIGGRDRRWIVAANQTSKEGD
jgi:hypothetical protein